MPPPITSEPTTHTAFIHHGPFNAESRTHRALRWIEEVLTSFFDVNPSSPDHPKSQWTDYYTPDFSMITPHGEHADAGFSSWSTGASKFYTSRFVSFRHVPYTLIATPDTVEGGFDVYCLLNVYANLNDEEKKAEEGEVEKVTDELGQEWDVRVPLFYNLDLREDESGKTEGLKLKHLQFVMGRGGAVQAAQGTKKCRHEDHVQGLKYSG